MPNGRRQRSLLSVPASDQRKLDRALTCAADELVLDLEDAVAPEHKTDARHFLTRRAWTAAHPRLTVRVNGIGTPWCHHELVDLCDPRLPFGALLVPKVESSGDLAFVDRLLDGAEAANGRRRPIEVIALIETARGLARLDEIVHASTRLTALAIGYADLAASLGRPGDADPQMWWPAQQAVLTAARSAGIAAIDGPFLGVDASEKFRAAVRHAEAFGFDAKWVIHPRQIEEVNLRFTPSPQQVETAERTLDALADAHRQGQGAVAVDGLMVDEALAASARRVLARAAARPG